MECEIVEPREEQLVDRNVPSHNRAEPAVIQIDEIEESEVIQEPAVIAELETTSDGSEQEETTGGDVRVKNTCTSKHTQAGRCTRNDTKTKSFIYAKRLTVNVFQGSQRGSELCVRQSRKWK